MTNKLGKGMIRVRHQRAMTLYREELGMQIAPYSDKTLERVNFKIHMEQDQDLFQPTQGTKINYHMLLLNSSRHTT
jgi:hypothetical protein